MKALLVVLGSIVVAASLALPLMPLTEQGAGATQRTKR